jgi:hypothetical protein
MDKFWELLQSSVIVSGTIALALVTTVCYLAIAGRPVPDAISAALMAVIGFFFGARKGTAEGTAAGVKSMGG